METRTTDSGLTRSAVWLADGPIDRVRERLIATIHEQHGRVGDATPDGFEASFGSRLAARLGGVVLKASRERLPMRARIGLVESDGGHVRVEVELRDDEGWNAVSITSLRRGPYGEAMDRLVTALERATPGDGP